MAHQERQVQPLQPCCHGVAGSQHLRGQADAWAVEHDQRVLQGRQARGAKERAKQKH